MIFWLGSGGGNYTNDDMGPLMEECLDDKN